MRREHLATPEQVNALARELGNPQFDPHGDPIPTASGEMPKAADIGRDAAKRDDRFLQLVGLGTIARTHLAVLGERSDVQVVGGVDPARPAVDVPVHRTLDEALSADPAPELVVVATPTDTHVPIVREVRAKPSMLWIEVEERWKTAGRIAVHSMRQLMSD